MEVYIHFILLIILFVGMIISKIIGKRKNKVIYNYSFFQLIKKLKFSLCLPGILLFFYYLIQKNAFVCGFTFLFVCLNFVLKECSRKVAGIIIGLILSLIFILMFYTEVLL